MSELVRHTLRLLVRRASPEPSSFGLKGLIDVKPLISATAPFTEAHAAFELATDRSRSMKVQLAF